MTETIAWGSGAYKTWGSVHGEGRVVIDGTAKLYATNDYTGGTFIQSGSLNLYGSDRLPTNGIVSVEEPGVFYMRSNSQQLGELHGDGTVRFTEKNSGIPATNTVTGVLSPGIDGPGTLTFEYRGNLLLTETTTSIFELDALDGENDLVKFTGSIPVLTLGGTLKVVNLGNMETGTYTLFNMAGGTIEGQFDNLDLPSAIDGKVEIDGKDVVLRAYVRRGSMIILR